jgi:DNA-binding XRE family transcriptional regulator
VADRDDPLALRWLIGVELTNFRKRAGRKATEAAKVIGCSPGKIGHLESGRNQQQPAEVTALLRYYGADLADIDRLASGGRGGGPPPGGGAGGPRGGGRGGALGGVRVLTQR